MTASLRHAALSGGAFVAARQGISLVVGLLGTLSLTALLGPAGYGRFAAALALYAYVFTVAPLGVNAWLVRRPPAAAEDPAQTPLLVASSVRSLLLLSSLVVGGAAVLALPLVERWLNAPDVRVLTLMMLAGLPLQMLNLVPLAVLERGLAYRKVAGAELQGLLLFNAVAVGLVWRGWGPEGIVIGWLLQHVWIGLRLHAAAEMFPRLGWDSGVLRDALAYGLRYASSLWTYQLRDLVNPLIVGRWQGVEGVAIVALAVRLVEAASFIKVATWRLALPALARLQHDTARLAVAVRDGLRLQLLLVGPALVILAAAGVPVAVWLFGPDWASIRAVMPLVAAGTLCNAAFNLHSSALYALGRASAVWRFHVVHIALFAGAAALLVPSQGVAGYGLAELVAFPSYVVVSRALSTALGNNRVTMREEFVFALCLVSATALAWLHPAGALVALLPLTMSGQRAMMREGFATLRSALNGRFA